MNLLARPAFGLLVNYSLFLVQNFLFLEESDSSKFVVDLEAAVSSITSCGKHGIIIFSAY